MALKTKRLEGDINYLRSKLGLNNITDDDVGGLVWMKAQKPIIVLMEHIKALMMIWTRL